MRAALIGLSLLVGLGCGSGAPGERGAANGASGGSVNALGGSGSGGSGTAAGGASPFAGAGANSGGSAANTGGSASSQNGGAGGAEPLPKGPPALRTVVYLPSYRGALSNWIGRIDGSRMSYLNLCFAEVSAEGAVSYPDTGLDAFVTAAHSAGVKVCMAIGGGAIIDTGGPFATVLQDGSRDAFVDELVEYAAQHQLDCIDVDLEGNAVNQYYEAFVTSLAAKLHGAGKEMTAAVGSWFGDRISGAAIQSFDFINVMAYDLHNPFAATEPVQSASIEEATQEVEYWIGRGLAKEKAVFGVPFYGFRWVDGKSEALTYAQILAGSPAAETTDRVDLSGAVTYLNSRTTIVAKAQLAKQYGGIMVWELGQDAGGDASLLKAIADSTR
jgi:hypothetical protein